MEQFEQQPKNANVKEKSMYLLHLDGARILILSAITIGLLTVAFLVGMKITGDSSKDTLAASDSLSDQSLAVNSQDPIDASKPELPDPLHGGLCPWPLTPSAFSPPSCPPLGPRKT